uniref:MFS domain-containing protein n=1 Tax=Panagrellus redivivus TaxID=6233 RepID=A0A7E4VHZ7_PANRE
MSLSYVQQVKELCTDRFVWITFFHTIFSCYGEIQINIFNFMSASVRPMFNESLTERWDPEMSEKTFNLIYSISASSVFGGILFGGLINGPLMDYLGRRTTSVFFRGGLSILSGIAMILSHFTPYFEFFIIGHILAGLVVTGKYVLVVYTAECAPDSRRGVASLAVGGGASIIMMIATPLCLPSILGTRELWWWLPAICVCMAIVDIFGSSFMPESPKHLYLGTQDKAAAAEAVKFYHGDNADIDAVFEEYEAEKEAQLSETLSISQILGNPVYRKAFFIVFATCLLVTFSGINIRCQYQMQLLQKYGLSHVAAVKTMVFVTYATFPLVFVAPIVIEKLGRRPIILTTSILSIGEVMFLAAGQFIIDNNPELVISSAFGVMAVVLGTVGINLGQMSMAPILVSELCPHAARGSITQMIQIIPIIFAVISVATYPTGVANFGASYFIPQVVGLALFFVYIYKTLPETKGLPIDKIIEKLAGKSKIAAARFDTNDETVPLNC